jgi:hypothetical protein
MAAPFHVPHSHRRRRFPASPAVALVPPPLAPVFVMPRPAPRPARLVLLSCPSCDLAADPMPAEQAEQLAGTHDDLHHGGRPTAVLRTDPRPGYTLGAGGSDFGGAA